MASADISLRCLHCEGTLQQQEVMEGWCDSCGKRVPPSYRDVYRGNAPAWLEDSGATAPTEDAGRGWLWGLLTLGLFLLVVVSFIAVMIGRNT